MVDYKKLDGVDPRTCFAPCRPSLRPCAPAPPLRPFFTRRCCHPSECIVPFHSLVQLHLSLSSSRLSHNPPVPLHLVDVYVDVDVDVDTSLRDSSRSTSAAFNWAAGICSPPNNFHRSVTNEHRTPTTNDSRPATSDSEPTQTRFTSLLLRSPRLPSSPNSLHQAPAGRHPIPLCARRPWPTPPNLTRPHPTSFLVDDTLAHAVRCSLAPTVPIRLL